MSGLRYFLGERKIRAFSLIELMVSMAILTVLIVVLMSMVDGATRLWRHSENRVDSYREARAAINMIADDMNSVLISTNTIFFLLDYNDKLPSTASTAPTASSIFFLSAQPKESQETSLAPPQNSSDLCLIGYFLAYDKVTSGSPAPSLNIYRYFVSSGKAFETIQQQKLLAETLSTAPTAASLTGAEVLARNVSSFKIRAFSVDYSANPQGVVTPFKQNKFTPIPDFVDIELTALNNGSVKRFKNKSDWTNTNSPTYQQNARKFKTRVYLRTDAVTTSSSVTPTPNPTPTPTPIPS